MKLDDAKKDAFEQILRQLAKHDAFNGAKAPSLFIVYAHDVDNQPAAHAGCVHELIRWLRMVNAKILSDKSPLLLYEKRVDGDEAIRDIVSNQLCLLTTSPLTQDRNTIDSVDKVIVCGSPLLEKYYNDSFTPQYLTAIKEAYNNGGDTQEEQIRSTVRKHHQDEGFHHVLTELAFLQLRHARDPESHGIIRLSIDGGDMDYLAISEHTELRLKTTPDTARLQKVFFKLLTQICPKQHSLIDQFKDGFYRVHEQLEDLEQESQLSNESFKSIIDCEMSLIHERRLDHITSASRVHDRDLLSTANLSNDQIDELCLRALQCPKPNKVKERMKEEKDKLVTSAFDWIFEDSIYTTWQDGTVVGLLWIKGGPGMGKSMMSIGLIEALERIKGTTVAYSFCQDGNRDLNTVGAIIKSLIYSLAEKHPRLMRILRSQWDTQKDCFTVNIESWRVLWDLFTDMLRDCQDSRIFLVVDALDECKDDSMSEFLRLIVRTHLDCPSNIKWLVTSRPLDSAEKELLSTRDQQRLSLELNSEHLAKGVRTYIQHKVKELDRRQDYGSNLRQEMEQKLDEKAEQIFLWVHLVCQRLENVPRDNALMVIEQEPPGLEGLYDRALLQLCNGETSDVKRCARLLRVMLWARRSVHILELPGITDLFDIGYDRTIRILERCQSFVRFHDNMIDSKHQSARDYLLQKNSKTELDKYDQYRHMHIAHHCIVYLKSQLKANLCGVKNRDATPAELSDEEREYLIRFRYACTFWFEHLAVAKGDFQKVGLGKQMVYDFLRTHFLQWLECLSWLDELSFAMSGIDKLIKLSKRKGWGNIENFVSDAGRFLQRHFSTILQWPLQVYSSAIIFSPEQSLVRKQNSGKVPRWMKELPLVEHEWSPLIKILYGHTSLVSAVIFSPDGKLIASASNDNSLKIWDVKIGQVQQSLKHENWLTAMAFSPDGQWITSGSRYNKTVRIWDVKTGKVQKTLHHSDEVNAIAFSPNGELIASGSSDKTIRIWNVKTGRVVHEALEGHAGPIKAVAFSPDGVLIVSGSGEETARVRIWNVETGQVQKTLGGHKNWVRAVAFSPDGQRIATGSDDCTIKIRDSNTGKLKKTLRHSGSVRTIAFSPNGRLIVSGSSEKTVRIWNVKTGQVQKALDDHTDQVRAVAFSPNGQQIACGSDDATIRLLDAKSSEVQNTLESHTGWVPAIAFSLDGQQVASGSHDKTVRLWDTKTGRAQKTLEGHVDWVLAVTFSADGQQIASGSRDQTVKLWDVETGQVQNTLEGHSNWIRAVAFSPDGQQIASGSDDKTIKLWDAKSGQVLQTLEGHSDWVRAIAFSPDGQRIASRSDDRAVRLWDVKIAPPSGSSTLEKLREVLQQTQIALGSKSTGTVMMETPGRVDQVEFTSDGQHIVTNQGVFAIQEPATGQSKPMDPSQAVLHLQKQWVCADEQRLVYLPAGYVPITWKAQGSRIAIGCEYGQVIILTIYYELYKKASM